MRLNEHRPPHFHVRYGEYVAAIEIGSDWQLKGDLPNRAYRLVLEWAQQHEEELRTKDLGPLLHGEIFEPMRNDLNYFRQVFVDTVSETIAWPNGADMDADVLRYDLIPAWMEAEQIHAAV